MMHTVTTLLVRAFGKYILIRALKRLEGRAGRLCAVMEDEEEGWVYYERRV